MAKQIVQSEVVPPSPQHAGVRQDQDPQHRRVKTYSINEVDLVAMSVQTAGSSLFLAFGWRCLDLYFVTTGATGDMGDMRTAVLIGAIMSFGLGLLSLGGFLTILRVVLHESGRRLRDVLLDRLHIRKTGKKSKPNKAASA